MSDRPAARTLALIAVFVLSTAFLIGAPRKGNQAKAGAAAPEVLRLPTGWQLNRGPMGLMRTEVALSPDGNTLVFSASPDGAMPKARLYRRSLDAAEATLIPGVPEGACLPTFSPDGQSIVFWAGEKLQKLQKVAVQGGMPVALCDLKARPFGLAWAPDGRIIYGTAGAGLAYVPAAGGTPQVLTTIDRLKEQTHRLPHLLPGGKALLFTAMLANLGLETRLEWLSLETGQRKLLVEDAADGRYLATGHLAFVRRGALMVVPFDLARLQTTGRAVTAVPGLMQALNTLADDDGNSGAGQYSVSESGALIWATGGLLPDGDPELYWVDRSGRAELWPALAKRAVNGFRLSPDGRRLVFATTGGAERAVWVYDMRRNRATVVASDTQSFLVAPLWAPDGRRVVFSWWQASLRLWLKAVDGTEKGVELQRSEFGLRGNSWSRDGKYLAFVQSGGGTGNDIVVLRMADRQTTPFVATKAAEAFPEFPPDGRWLAYVSNETGRNEVYVRSFPDGKRTLPVSADGGTAPMWGRDGRELFYWNIGFKQTMKVDVSPGETLSVGTPRPLFPFNGSASAMVRMYYDITPDGQRFLIQKAWASKPTAVTELNLVRRWFDELKRISPTAK